MQRLHLGAGRVLLAGGAAYIRLLPSLATELGVPFDVVHTLWQRVVARLWQRQGEQTADDGERAEYEEWQLVAKHTEI